MDDIVCFEVVNISKFGITVKNEITSINISFDECTKSFANENHVQTSRCVASRDITKLTFTFYTSPKIKVVFKKRFFQCFMRRKNAINEFLKLQKAIEKYGYSTYDLS